MAGKSGVFAPIAEDPASTLSGYFFLQATIESTSLPIESHSNASVLRHSLYHCSYQSECGDQRAQERHWVEVHWWRHSGHTPPVSNVFH